MLASGAHLANWDGLEPTPPPHRNLDTSEKHVTNNGNLFADALGLVGMSLQSPTLSPGSTPEVDKRRSIVSAGGGLGSLKSTSASTKSSHNSISEHQQPPILSQGSPNTKNNNNNNNQDGAKNGITSGSSNNGWRIPGLSFTQQVQQFSKVRGRPGSRLLSPLNEPTSPIYASPPQSPSSDSINDERLSPSTEFPAMDYLHHHRNNNLQNMNASPVLTNGLQPFAFTRVKFCDKNVSCKVCQMA